MIIKEKNNPKIFKIFKIFKIRAKAKSKAMALASLVSFQEQKQNQKQEWIRFAHEAFLLASLDLGANIM